MKNKHTPAEMLPGKHSAVHFEIEAPGAREVYLAGTFCDWHATTLPMVQVGRSRWAKELTLPPGHHEYLFVIDGQWRPDPAAPSVPNPFGGVNSCVEVG
jgi:1,4-alpha-glucan branching enzyme